ncbi:MAG: tRNA (guanosine(46)-N7)-methyltransferase TrmB [Bacilli bacterium]|nr:tRNA (guanosine(46)-N7)-methyltransferase TrmB [Bacilli bacterium]
MRMRNPKYKDEVINNCTFLLNDEIDFENDAPLHIEIGMGKGNFILNMALNNPDINFIGIEKYSSVASVAIKKMMEYNLPNLRVIISDIMNLEELLKNKVDVIYLNFSDPWPKDRHAKRRLTSPNFLKLYDSFFKEKNVIIQKTDNDNLFSYSVDSIREYGYEIEEISYDLHSTDIPNVMTEYEKKFSSQGVKIKYLKASK